jgi:succinyl-diaminopimelate desuccinylase
MEHKMITEKNVLNLMQSLVAIPSPYFEEEEIVGFVNDWLRGNGLSASIHEYHENKVTGFKGKNVLLELVGDTPGPTIHINGHLDTVKLCAGWTEDAYQGRLDGDKLYGLGVLDMKSGVAATMSALKEFADLHKKFKGRILASFVSVEEGPYGMGTNALIEDGLLGGVDLSITTEPSAGFTDQPFPVVCLGARGGYGLEIDVFGKSSHAAFPKAGKSAVLDAAKIICELENVDYISDPHLGSGDACVIGVESDGGACSVPDYAKIRLFWHIVVGEDTKSIHKEIEKAIDRAGVQCDWKVRFREAPSEDSKGFQPYKVSEQDPMVGSFLESVSRVCGIEPTKEYFKSIGDFNYLGSRIDAPVVIFGPEGKNFHGQDEYATLSSTVETAKVLLDFLEKTLVE